MNTTTLYRPVGPAELELIRASGMRRFPPRLPVQPIFYPVGFNPHIIWLIQLTRETFRHDRS
jgi:hypothetical protein